LSIKRIFNPQLRTSMLNHQLSNGWLK
jgi:hypothetical protein